MAKVRVTQLRSSAGRLPGQKETLVGLGLKKIRIMTNNPKKRAALEGFGLTEVESVPLVVGLHEENQRYMETKRDKMGHILPDDLRVLEPVDEQPA